MPGAKDENFDGLTIKYNGVQFGGTGGQFPSQPPTYSLDQIAVYDEANRVITHIRYVLTVFCTFYDDTELNLSLGLDTIKSRLLKAGEPLEVKGIGLGFIEQTADQNWGPKPISFNYPRTHGVRATDTVWVVEFNGPPCQLTFSAGGNPLRFMAVNSASTYSNDFEGQTVRTITGYYQMPQSRQRGLFGGTVDADKRGSKLTLDRVADQMRDGIRVFLPVGFRRVQNTWRGNAAKNRVDFTVIDEALPGRAYPVGISRITNDQLEFSTDPFTATQGNVTLTATITVAPGFPPSLAGVHFMALAARKQAEMVQRLRAQIGPKGSRGTAFVLPTRLIIRSGLYDNARTSSFLTQWATTGCLANILFHSPWSPVPNTNYEQWRTSIEHLWRNSGNKNLKDLPANDVIISVCKPKSIYETGKTIAPSENPETPTDMALLPCPEIPEESSWISYDVEVTYYEVKHDFVLRKMFNAFSASVPGTGIGAAVTTATNMVLGTKWKNDDDTKDIISQNGPPEIYILVRAKGRRVNHNPVFPTLTTVGGVKVNPVTAAKYTIKTAAKFGNCAILEMSGFQWYKAEEWISDYGPKDNPVLCATTQESSADV